MNPKAEPCTKPYCFFCAMNEPNPLVRRTKLTKCFKEMPFRDDPEHVLALSSLWTLAMNKPNDPEFPSLGIFKCMSNFILKGINHRDWLLSDQNIYIPYYAAHIIGSYTMNNPKFAEKAVNSGVIPPLLELLRGKITWVEQRVAVRALGHLAIHEASFEKLVCYEQEILGLSMEMASTCLKLVYDEFVKKTTVTTTTTSEIRSQTESEVSAHSALPHPAETARRETVSARPTGKKKAVSTRHIGKKAVSARPTKNIFQRSSKNNRERLGFIKRREAERLKYQCDLLTRGVGGLELENRKAEEWASQLQCWSLSLLDCFVRREKGLHIICNHQSFLKDLGGMWGGLVNKNSPAGIGLLRNLCHSKTGRISVADSNSAVLSLCNTSRSSDDWQYMAVESLLLLLKDPDTRYKVIDPAAFYLKDLVEIRSIKEKIRVGEAITQVLLQDYSKIRYGQLRLSERAEKALEEIWNVRVEKRKREKLMSEEEIGERKSSATQMKKQGNKLFWGGDIEGALVHYKNALDLCPSKYKKERIVLHSNRAQCYLLLENPENAISDTTKAICLSSKGSPHSKSLWRRSQAYDMVGLPKESLMDCLLFINCNKGRRRRINVPYYAARLISKQIRATWLFASVSVMTPLEDFQESDGCD